MLRDEVKKHKCDNCYLAEWLDKPIPLELHHINGDKYDFRLENILFLCPNCHTLTDNYKGKSSKKFGIEKEKSIKQSKETRKKILKTLKCKKCNVDIYYNSKTGYCRKCYDEIRCKVPYPDLLELKERIKHSNIEKISRELGVSSNAIRKWFLKSKIDLKGCCNKSRYKLNNLNLDDLKSKISTNGITAVAKELSVDRHTIKRFLKRNNIE